MHSSALDLILDSISEIKGACTMLPEIEIDEHLFLESVNQIDHEWRVCIHFRDPEDLYGVVKHYKNFNALIVFCGTILRDQCYKSLIEGQYQRLFDSSFDITNTQYKQIMGNALLDVNKEIQSDLIFSV